MLEKALAGDADNVDLAVALAGLQLRGVQMVWYSPAESEAAQASAKSILEHALRVKPTSIPVLEAYCRFLNATNEFVESLVACSRTLNFDPWDGPALTHIGLAQLQLGRFEDALATFKQAYLYDTPQVSRWTWQLDMGMTYLVMRRSADALPWLQGAIAITAGIGAQLHAAGGRLPGFGPAGRGKSGDGKGNDVAAWFQLEQCDFTPEKRQPGFSCRSRMDRAGLCRGWIAGALVRVWRRRHWMDSFRCEPYSSYYGHVKASQ